MQRNATQLREHAQAADQVADFMRRHGLSLADPIEIGGEDLRPTSAIRGKAHCVERCWEMMARLHVKHADLGTYEPSTAPMPGSAARGRCLRERRPKAQQNQLVDRHPSPDTNRNEINDLTISGSIGDPETKSGAEPTEGTATTPKSGHEQEEQDDRRPHCRNAVVAG